MINFPQSKFPGSAKREAWQSVPSLMTFSLTNLRISTVIKLLKEKSTQAKPSKYQVRELSTFLRTWITPWFMFLFSSHQVVVTKDLLIVSLKPLTLLFEVRTSHTESRLLGWFRSMGSSIMSVQKSRSRLEVYKFIRWRTLPILTAMPSLWN